MVVTAEQYLRNDFTEQLREARKTADPQIVNGVQKAIGILGESPQEIMAKCVKQMMNPGEGRAGLSPEQIAAIPKDFKTVGHFLKMLQEAQVIHDTDLKGNNPFGDATPEELRSIMLKGAIDHAETDAKLRKQLIHGFLDRFPNFLDEVLEVANEINQGGLISASN